MAVRCGGDPREIEQIGEKQDFECELSRLGFKHEDFALHVRRANVLGAGSAWTAHYAVRVTNIPTARQMFYWGGPGERWVDAFAADAAKRPLRAAGVQASSDQGYRSESPYLARTRRPRCRSDSSGIAATPAPFDGQAAIAKLDGRRLSTNCRVAAAHEY